MSKTLTIMEWPRHERPREKLLFQGAHTLSDAELVAIFLRVGTRGKTAVDLARELLQRYGSLRKLLHTSVDDFCALPGMGESKYTQFQAALELGKRYLQERLHKDNMLHNQDDIIDYLAAKLRDRKQEVFAVLFLDVHHRLICYEEIFNGTLNRSHIYPREIVKRALHHNAHGVIFTHNHPSGNPEASESDIQLTQQLQQTLELMDIEVYDHIIIGDGKSVSFNERGWL